MSLGSEFPAPQEQYKSLRYFSRFSSGSLFETLWILPPQIWLPQARNSRIFISYLQILLFLVIRHIFCNLSVVLLLLLSVCLGFSVIWLPAQLPHWLAAGCLDSWPQAHGSALFLLSVAWHHLVLGSSNVGSSGLSPKYNTELQNQESSSKNLYTCILYVYNINL